MRQVARIVPRGMPSASCAVRGRRRSRAAPRGGSPSWAGRSTARSPCRWRSARWWSCTCRSRTGCRRPARRRRARAARAGASRGCARRASPPRPSARSDLPSGLVKSICRSQALRRFSWPCTRLSKVGVLLSSKSAMKTFAPQFSALMTILRSVGPVISTRRSTRPGAGSAHRQSPPRTSAVSGRKSGSAPAASSASRRARACSSSSRRGPNSRCSAGEQLQRLGGQHLLVAVPPLACDLDAVHLRGTAHVCIS